MKQTISKKAEIAINQLNQTALLMHRQMKSSEINQPVADKAISVAQSKVKTWRKSYFARTSDPNHLPQLEEFHRSNLQDELEIANNRFGRVLKHFAKTVGAESHPAEEIMSGAGN